MPTEERGHGIGGVLLTFPLLARTWQLHFHFAGIKAVYQSVRYLAVLALLVSTAYADRCATPEEVRDRQVSPNYEWSVNDYVTLDTLLSVKHLYGVTIENYGEFVACKYEAEQQYIRLDGAPGKSRCPIRPVSIHWFASESGRTVCEEKDKTLCRFGPDCK